jgi:caffeoyl-CoA O-methyltransferase
MSIVPEALDDYAFRSTTPEPGLLTELSEETWRTMEWPQMLTGRIEGRFLKLLVQIAAPRLVVEVGTFTGYSALSMAEGLPEDGRLITCEVDPRAQKMAQAAFNRSPHGERIEIRMGPAIVTIRAIDEPIGFSFIDADKVGYPDYYEALLERTVPGGLILMDNMLQGGRVLEPDDDSARAIDGLNRRLVEDDRVECVLLTVRDGVQLVRKR